jgi:hypothetical protein
MNKRAIYSRIGRYILLGITLVTFLNLVSSKSSNASLYAQSSSGNTLGTVLNVVNDEIFTIAVCNGEKVYKEFSYCFEVRKGDMVIFDWDPCNCDVVSFKVLNSDIQCGVFCP